MRKRQNIVYVRMNDEEYELLKKKLEQTKLTLQSYIINSSLNAKVPTADEVNELKKLNQLFANYNRQLKGIAVNINQMAKKINSNENIEYEQLLKIDSQLLRMKEEVQELWRLIRLQISQARIKLDSEM